MKLTSLAPDIVATILDDRLPSGVTLFDFSEEVMLLWGGRMVGARDESVLPYTPY